MFSCWCLTLRKDVVHDDESNNPHFCKNHQNYVIESIIALLQQSYTNLISLSLIMHIYRVMFIILNVNEIYLSTRAFFTILL